MKHLSINPLFAAALVALGCKFAAHSAFAQTKVETASIAEIRALQRDYVTSINEADTSIVDRIWSHSPEVIFIEPLGTEHGIEQVKGFVANTFGKMFSKRDLNLETPAIHVYGDTAWSDMTWTFHATIRGNNQPITTQGRETQIYRKRNGAWHIVAVHYSGLPTSGALKGF